MSATDDERKALAVNPSPENGETPEMEATTTENSTNDKNDNGDDDKAPITKDELLELVKAIQFAHPEKSQRQVWREISETLGEKVPCLQQVTFTDVKKVWKKATQQQQQQQQQNNQSSSSSSSSSSPHPNQDLAEKLQGTTPQLFTVGDASQVYQLAQDITAASLIQAAQKEKDANNDIHKNYVHVFLDVPADKSGARPHQALINFQQQATTPSNNNSTKSSKNKNNKKQSSKKASSSTTTATTGNAASNSIIVKIQRAAPLSPHDTTKHPMLLYDQSRALKTFIHPEEAAPQSQADNEHVAEDGYDTIAQWIAQQGTDGALASAGGTKAYFYARLTKRRKGPNILSIQMDALAPPQTW